MTLTTVLAFIFLKGIASGNLVDTSIKVNKYILPAFVLGSGPTTSMSTLGNGGSKAGIGIKGAFSIGLFGLPTNGKCDRFYNIP